MDFEKIKAEWRDQKFEGYLFEKPPSRIVADVRRKAMDLRSRHAMEDVGQVLVSILVSAMWIFLYSSRQPMLARAGMILLAIGSALEGLTYLWMRFRYRGDRFDLPRNDLLRRERKRIEERIRLRKASFTWLSVPLMTGLILYMASMFTETGELFATMSGIAMPWAVLIWVNNRRIRKQMLPLLEEIKQKLAESESQSLQ
jgi:hypothetical protein